MYIFAVAFFMFVFPIVSIAIDLLVGNNDAGAITIFGQWFIFWAVGVRLFTAGLRQIIKPNLTSEGILGIKSKEAWQLVRELGFANVSIGLIAIISLWIVAWQPAAALAGGLFLLLAGIEHIPKKHRSFEENIAMVSDLLIGLLLLVYLVGVIQ
jgi:hypothetical protein